MTRRLTVLFSAFEALLVVAIGVAIPLVPLTIVWAAGYGFAPDWGIFWRGAVDSWLLGHGVDITFTLDPATAASLGVTGAGDPVRITLAALGFALLTLLLGVRAGARVAETGHRMLGEVTAFAVFAVLSGVVTTTSLHPAARPSLWQGILLPSLVFGAGLLLGVLREGRDLTPGAAGSSLRDWIDDWRPAQRATAAAALRAGTAAAAITLLVSAVTFALLLLANYARIIQLYESLHTELVGGVAITAGQLALLPDLVIWTASWLVGPGFAIGAGSTVSPLGTALGPIPAIPVLGALPPSGLAFGFAGLLVPVVAGFLAGAAVRARLLEQLEEGRALAMGVTALVGGMFGGLLLGLLAWAASGSAGPGRLGQVGPDPWAVGIVAAIEFAVAIGLGLASGGASRLIGRRSGAR